MMCRELQCMSCDHSKDTFKTVEQMNKKILVPHDIVREAEGVKNKKMLVPQVVVREAEDVV